MNAEVADLQSKPSLPPSVVGGLGSGKVISATGPLTLAQTVHESLFPTNWLGGIAPPTLEADGRIRMPGLQQGIPVGAYVPMLHLYSSIQEADRLMEPFRRELALKPKNMVHCGPSAVTALTPSNLHSGLFYKREDQTAIKAYKARGAFCGMRRVMETEGVERFVAVSTGNHALGVLKAAELLRPKRVKIVVPNNTAPLKLRSINSKVLALRHRGVEAEVLYIGQTFDEARHWALEQQQAGDYYLDPYSNPWVVAGQGTIGLELYRQLAPLLVNYPDLKEIVLVSPVGGGGLLGGTATALQLAAAWDNRFAQLSIRFVGLRLAHLQSSIYGDAIRVQEVAQGNQALFEALAVEEHPIDDAIMAEGMWLVKDDLNERVEGPSGATRAMVARLSNCQPNPERLTVCLLSGGNVNTFPKQPE